MIISVVYFIMIYSLVGCSLFDDLPDASSSAPTGALKRLSSDGQDDIPPNAKRKALSGKRAGCQALHDMARPMGGLLIMCAMYMYSCVCVSACVRARMCTRMRVCPCV